MQRREWVHVSEQEFRAGVERALGKLLAVQFTYSLIHSSSRPGVQPATWPHLLDADYMWSLGLGPLGPEVRRQRPLP